MRGISRLKEKGSHPVRVLVGLLLAGSVVLAVSVSPPSDLPSIALGQTAVYRVEIGLGAFYAGLLILLPAYRGIINGKLPTSISSRGAEFAEAVDWSLEKTQDSVEDLQAQVRDLDGRMGVARLRIDELAEKTKARAG
jgi:hypothetical protein